MARGGPGRGQGRKPKADEDKVRNLAVKAITERYGSEKEGFMALLNSLEPSLMKFVFEHAFGKPKERLEHSGEMGIIWNEVKNYGAKPKADHRS